MQVSINGKIGSLPVSLDINLDADDLILQAVRGMSARVSPTAGGQPAVTAEQAGAFAAGEAPTAAPKRKRRPPQRRITHREGKVVVSSPEMNMLKALPKDGSPMGLGELAQKVWPGRTARDGGPLVGPAARVAGGLRDKELATIVGKGGDKTVSADTNWKNKAVEVQK